MEQLDKKLGNLIHFKICTVENIAKNEDKNYLFCQQPGRDSLNVVLNGEVDKLVLRLRLHHSRPLRPHLLDSTLNVYFTVKTCAEITVSTRQCENSEW